MLQPRRPVTRRGPDLLRAARLVYFRQVGHKGPSVAAEEATLLAHLEGRGLIRTRFGVFVVERVGKEVRVHRSDDPPLLRHG